MRVFLLAPTAGLAPDVERAFREAAAEGKHDVLPDVPAAHAGLAASERQHFLALLDRLMEADMLVADVSAPDASVAWCVAWFLARGRLAVLSCRRDARAALSPMFAGNPSPWQRLLVYDDVSALRQLLKQTLS